MWLFSGGSRVLLTSFSHRLSFSPLVVLRSVMDKATLFQSIGLSEQKAQETLKNDALSKRLESIINLVSTVCSLAKEFFWGDITEYRRTRCSFFVCVAKLSDFRTQYDVRQFLFIL